jgi:lipoyl(octanoyl) transferase
LAANSSRFAEGKDGLTAPGWLIIGTNFMGLEKEARCRSKGQPGTLRVYLLGTVDFEAWLRCQRRLHYEVAGDPEQAVLVLCEHPPLISVGRHGSRSHIFLEPHELGVKGWRVRWVNRGGGCWLHQPGQVSAYALLALDRLGLSLPAYQRKLGEVIRAWLGDFHVHCELRDGAIWTNGRPLAGLGFAVQNWVSYYGACLNINPVLDPYKLVRCSARTAQPMTSLERERRGRVSPSLARQRFIECFQQGFGFSRVSLFTEHLSLAGSSERSLPPRVAARK